MEVKGSQFGNIQNGDTIINNGNIAMTLTDVRLRVVQELGALQDHLAGASTRGVVEPDAAQAASVELATATREVASGHGTMALPALERAQHILSAVAGTAPMVDAIVKIVGLINGSGN
ncbi:hypothetical protein Q2K19_04955 [Micromonospora soli]|uniref:hypothetical protein n=1 Tax=Micromonospora sp. NBRC 110009 TaxID=3061627 RepID=UPI0026712305|nr:hypothetical protein [Micromonospora sp. NBRC 110009]WKT99843.1 hypothetical protein Q2K19_04955 [Micromonospora sp. NBRC 110009]